MRYRNTPFGDHGRHAWASIPTFGTPLSFGTFVATYLPILVIALVPLALTPIAPLLDYPNHLARMHILLQAGESQALQEFYRVHWAPLPNLAMDLLVPTFAAVMPLELAGHVFIGLTLMLSSSGTAALHYAMHGRLTVWPLIVFLFLYNYIFFFGFLNYLFGVGVFLWAFAAWIYLRDTPSRVRLPILLVFALILYFSHLYALGLYGLAVVGYELWQWKEQRWRYRPRDVVAVAGPLVPPALMFLLLSPTASAVSSTGYMDLLNLIAHKVIGLFLGFSSYRTEIDGIIVFAVICLILIGSIGRTLTVARAARWPLVLFLAAYAVMPSWLFGSAFADLRLPVVFAPLLVAGCALHWQRPLWSRCLVIGLFAVFLVRVAVVAFNWQSAGTVYAEYIEAFDEIPKGRRLLPVFEHRPKGVTSVLTTPIYNIASLAVIAKSAYVPSMYATPEAQTIVAVAANRPPYRLNPPAFRWLLGEHPVRSGFDIWNRQAANVEYLRNNWKTYDYLLLLNRDTRQNPLPSLLSSVFEGSDFTLFKIRGGDDRR